MERHEIRLEVIKYLRENITKKNIQLGDIYHFLQKKVGHPEIEQVFNIAREIINDLSINNIIYFGLPTDFNISLPWITITAYGKKCLAEENWLPYDPEGYLDALSNQVPSIDEVTLKYIGESISVYNKNCLLSSMITLGVASENMMLNLIEAFTDAISDTTKQSQFKNKVKDKFIFTQYREFIKEFRNYTKNLPEQLTKNLEVYLEGIFNFIRLNRNEAGHPTGKELNRKIIYANLQIFADYSEYIYSLINFFHNNKI